jgi:DHA2 family multidrug resistance protein
VLIWAVWYGLDAEPMQLDRLRRGDWVGIVCVAIGLGSLITLLEEGERKEWFGSPMIQHLAILAAIFIPAFVIIELWHKEPFINLRLWARRGFASASFMGFVMGLGLYGTVYILPVYLAQIQGYNALQIGEVVMWLGLPQLAIFPLVPFVMWRTDPRLMVGFGLILFAISCFMNSFSDTRLGDRAIALVAAGASDRTAVHHHPLVGAGRRIASAERAGWRLGDL